jgi:hypothetical protein
MDSAAGERTPILGVPGAVRVAVRSKTEFEEPIPSASSH